MTRHLPCTTPPAPPTGTARELRAAFAARLGMEAPRGWSRTQVAEALQKTLEADWWARETVRDIATATM
jgi:hypothetical protein